jgi:hypothetical protein
MRAGSFWLILVLAIFAASDGDAAKKKKPIKKKPVKTATKKPAVPKANAEAVKQLMGDFKFGMTLDQTMAVIHKHIDAKYQAKIDAITDIYEQNKFRKAAAKEKADLKKGYVKFEGKESPWDVSIVDREFDHKNDEAMFVLWELDEATGKDQRRFYFFMDGALWKMYIAFNTDAFPENMTFAAFQAAMEKRYGAGAVMMKKDEDGVEQFDFVYWTSGNVLLRAIDQTKYYSSYCLALSDTTVEAQIYKRRAERNPKGDNKNPLVEAVTDSPDKDPNKISDENKDVIDQVTDKNKK